MKNVAVVVLDTVRRDYFLEHFDWLPGRRFENAYSTSNWTIPAHASLLTGFYPSEIGTHAKSRSLTDQTITTLPEAASSAGYTTRLWTANPQIYNCEGWDRGYDERIGPSNLDIHHDDVFDWQTYLNETDKDGIARYIDAVFQCLVSDSPTLKSLREGYRISQHSLIGAGGAREVRDRIKATQFDDDGEFLFINVMDAHTPYYPSEEFRTVDKPVNVTIGQAFAGNVNDGDTIITAYCDTIRYLSHIYREMFEELQTDFDFVVTLSDHGELLGEHGLWNHGYGIYPELTEIPLVLSGRDIEDGTVSEPVSILDVHQTLLDVMELASDSRGRCLTEPTTAEPLLTEYHGFLPWHREQFLNEGVEATRYDQLNSPLDGVVGTNGGYAYETHDGLVIECGFQDELEARTCLADLIESLDRKPIKEEYTEISDAVRDQLETLGYA